MTTPEVVQALKDLLTKQFKIRAPRIHSVTVMRPGEILSSDRTGTRKILPSQASPRPGQLKLLVIAQLDSNLKFIGSHFVISEQWDGSKIRTLDPNHPAQSFDGTYLGQVNWDGNDIPVFEYRGKARNFGLERFGVYIINGGSQDFC